MNLARVFSYTISLEQRIESLEAELNRVRLERTEWQNKFLAKVNTAPLFYQPPETKPIDLPPVGPAAKRLKLAQQQPDQIPSSEEIIAAAERAKAG